MTIIKEEIDDMAGAMIYIKFSGYYEKIDERKENKNQLQDTR